LGLRKEEQMKFTLDETDYLILEILQKNGRITMKELAEQIVMSAPAVTDRVRRLEDNGFIQGYRAVINTQAVALPVRALMLVDVPMQKRREFYDMVDRCSEICQANYVASGGKEAVLLVNCRDVNHLVCLQQDLFDIGNCTAYIIDPKPFKDQPVDVVLGESKEYEYKHPVSRGYKKD
jgi:Lrp/AsnC family leucine-responsive transcriptional regulator